MTTHSARPLTSREPGRVYGSWMDDPRRLLERRLKEMKAGEMFEFDGNTVKRYFSGGNNSYYVRNDERSAQFCGWAGAQLRVIDFLIGEPDKGTEDMFDFTVSERAMEVLQAANSQRGVSTLGKGMAAIIKSLEDKGLVDRWNDGLYRTTVKGQDYLHIATGRGEAPADDLRIEVVNQPIREPEPEPEPGPMPEAGQAPAPSSNGVVHETLDPVTAELHTVGGCSCAHRRALEYLMDQVPEVREVVEHFFALEKSVARLQGSAPHVPESARMKGPR